jgi:hypothetical protein
MDFDKKEAVRKIRKQIIEGAARGGWHQRIRLLTLAFLRGMPYGVLERTTHADGHCPIGRKNWYTAYLLPAIAAKVIEVTADEKIESWKIKKDSEEYKAVYNWVNEHALLDKAQEEAA